MKTFILMITLMLTGCASVSEYNQGCRDGIASVNPNGQGRLGPSKSIDKFCDGLEAQKKLEKDIHEGKR